MAEAADPAKQLKRNFKQFYCLDLALITRQQSIKLFLNWRIGKGLKKLNFVSRSRRRNTSKCRNYSRNSNKKTMIENANLSVGIKIEDQSIQKKKNQYPIQSGELQRREQKLVQLEEELKQKLQETAKIVKSKDEEQGQLIRKMKDEKLGYEKEKTILNLKLTDAQALAQKHQEDLVKLRKELENSPIALVRGDLQNKTLEINELKKEIEKINQIKVVVEAIYSIKQDQYKSYYEKIRDELIKQRRAYEELQQSQQNGATSEILKLKEALEELKTQKQRPMESQRKSDTLFQEEQQKQSQVVNPFNQALIPENTHISKQNQAKSSTKRFTAKSTQPKQSLNDLQRLIQERENLLASGEYAEDDPLIQELTKHIMELQN